MMHTTKVLSSALVLGSLLAATACAPEVLPFQETPPSARPQSSALNLAGDRTLSTLDDDEANELCSWLEATGQSAGRPGTESSPGYVGGAASGFTIPTDSRLLVWVHLDKSQCLLNLRHRACEATVSTLKRCITY